MHRAHVEVYLGRSALDPWAVARAIREGGYPVVGAAIDEKTGLVRLVFEDPAEGDHTLANRIRGAVGLELARESDGGSSVAIGGKCVELRLDTFARIGRRIGAFLARERPSRSEAEVFVRTLERLLDEALADPSP
jgi:hypothetical protein